MRTLNPSAIVLAEVEHLLAFGESPAFIARTLGVKPGAVARALERAGEPEMARMFERARRVEEAHPCADCGAPVSARQAPRCRRCGCVERERRKRDAA